MRGLRYAWALAVLSLCGIVPPPARAEVTTAGDTKDNGSTFYAGYNANTTGALTIDAGSVFNRSYGYLGYTTGSTGTATITGAGSKWTNSYNLYVGYNGSGTLRVEAGGQVSSSGGYLHSTGEAIITGPGSKWVNSGELRVDRGSLRVEAGGQVSSSNGYLDFEGMATITGAGSKWVNSSDLYLGYNGACTLTVADGGLVIAETLYTSLGDLYGNGTIKGGAVLDGELVFDAAHGAAQTVAFGTGGTLQLPTGGTLGVGYNHSGSLRIAEGRSVTSAYGYLGYNRGSTGTAIITGTGSKWTNSGLYVGFNGSGTLRVEAGGQVSSGIGCVGAAGTGGEAIVTGAGSRWTNSGDFYVGQYGSGKLTVSDGGVVSARTLYASLSNLYGNGTIAVNGAVLDADLVFDATHGLTQTLAFGSGGKIQLTVDGTGALGAGHQHSGSLRIAEGRSVSSAYGRLGFSFGSTGTAIVTGAGSNWTANWLDVGYLGSGALRVEAGGQVSSTDGYIGYNSAGSAIITGAGSKWTNSGELDVGFNDSGSLLVEAGGQLSSGGGCLGRNSRSTGEAIITGTGSKWSANLHHVGYKGSGTLRVEAGGQVSGGGSLGYSSGSTGIAIITGAGSTWINSVGLTVGGSGSGTLRVEAGGQVSSNGATLGSLSGSTGTAIITGAGSKWTNSGDLSVGFNGSGVLRAEGGGQISNTSSFPAYLGYNPGSTGEAIIAGAGSKWTDSWILRVGEYGKGTLRVEDAGQVSGSYAYLGYYSTGTALITGPGSKWTSSYNLYVGEYGSGTLTVEAGGQVSSTESYIGDGFGSSGKVTLTGPASTWTTSGQLYVGKDGTGLVDQSGGTVHAGSIIIGSKGSYILSAGLLEVSKSMTIQTGGSLSWQAGQLSTPYLALTGGRLALSPGHDKLLKLSSLSLTSAATLDLSDNALILQATSATRAAMLQSIAAQIRSARNTQQPWQGPGITSSAARDDATGLYGLAAILNADSQGQPLYTLFQDQPVDANSILVTYTLNGDADLNGILDGSDYFFIDKGYLSRNLPNPLTGYRNGDFNYDGTIDGSDYFLIDKAFLATHATSAAPTSSTVPEPAALALILAAATLLPRRRR